MFKTIIVSLSIYFLLFNNANANYSPEDSAVMIMDSAIQSIQNERDLGNSNLADVQSVIISKILPMLNIKESSRMALKKHWVSLNDKQKVMVEKYIASSLIDNYSSILHSYKNLNNLEIIANKNVKRKKNRAIVKLNIKDTDSNSSADVKLKMINNNNEWKIYDVVFSGVSLVKNYKSQFNSQIKRKGIDGFMKKISKKVSGACSACFANNSNDSLSKKS